MPIRKHSRICSAARARHLQILRALYESVSVRRRVLSTRLRAFECFFSSYIMILRQGTKVLLCNAKRRLPAFTLTNIAVRIEAERTLTENAGANDYSAFKVAQVGNSACVTYVVQL